MIPRSVQRPDVFRAPESVRAAPLALVADERDLVARVRTGDRRAFDVLFGRYYEPLVKFVAGYTRSLAVAEDLVQDVFLNVWTHREQWTIRDGVRAYLYGAARNRALNGTRHERVITRWAAAAASDQTVNGMSQGPESAEDRVRTAELTAHLQRAVAALPARRRQVYVLRCHHHLSYAEVAQVMGVSVKCVELQLAKALRSLREVFAELE
jgi:RNA polymerase sigma-70 factor (ECF subfamily)